MDKPITIVVEETEKKIVDLINTSGLPAFVIEPILRKLSNEAMIAKKKQYDIDMEKYQKSLAESNDKQSNK